MEKQFLLIFDNLSHLLNIISNYRVVHVYIDESVDSIMEQNFFSALQSRAKIIKTIIAPCYATETLANSLQYRGEDFVIAFGKIHLQSLVKYYSYAHNIEYAIVPVKEVAEYSFSKFAYIKDAYFCFYLCEKPTVAYICKDFFSDDNIFKLYKILSYKNIVMYEKEFEKLILKSEQYDLSNITKSINNCDGTYKSVIKLYGAIAMLLEKCKTKDFFGCEYTMLKLLNCNKKDVSTNLINSTNLLTKFYECFNKFDIIKIAPNYNKHIQLLKENYGISMLQVQGNILSKFSHTEMHRIEYTLKAYWPHLKVFFNNCKANFLFSATKFNSTELEHALALSSSVCSNKNLLKVARDFGYFENLIK